MSDNKINEQILTGIREHSKGDSAIRDFLLALIVVETTGPGWWKPIYKKTIDPFANDWGQNNED